MLEPDPAIDFGKTAADYALHRAGFPDAFFARLFAEHNGETPCRALDLGTGTGSLARGLAKQGIEVTGLDPSEPLLVEARRLDAIAGVHIDYVVATAEATGLTEASFDMVTAGQCWHWFDRPRAAAEAWRLLVPGGRLVIAHFDWLPLPGNTVEATERLILKHNPAWKGAGGDGIYPVWTRDVASAGFGTIETHSFDIDVEYTHEAWRGRVRASAGIAASLPPLAVARFDVELAAVLANDFPADPLAIPHRMWWLTCLKPA